MDLGVGLIAPFWLRFPQSYAWTSTVLVDELHAGGLKATPYDIKRGSSWFVRSGFQLPHGHNPNLSFACELLLAPI
jgi:hypothetical protein